MTFNRLRIFCLTTCYATNGLHSTANCFVQSSKLILTYVSLMQDQLLHFVLNQSVEVFLCCRIDIVLVAELVNEELGELLSLDLLLEIHRVVQLGPSRGLLRVHLWADCYN